MAKVRVTTPRENAVTFFDLQEGRLIVDQDSTSLLEQGVDLRDIVPLADALADDTAPPDPYEKLDCDDWSKDDYKKYAKWLSSFVEGPTPTRESYQAAFKLGIGPHPRRIKHRFGSIWQFHDEAELAGGFCRGKYSDWTNRDLIEYGQEVVRKRGGKKPDEATLQRHFKNRNGPSASFIYLRFGSLRNFHENLGFPNIHEWDKDDYVEYGIRVAEANENPRPSRTTFDTLSKAKRGPSARSIINHFGKLSDFQDAVEEERYNREIIQKQDDAENAAARWELVEKGIIPQKLFEHPGPHDVRTFLRQTARFLLVNHALPHEHPLHEKIEIALRRPGSIIKALLDRGSSLSAAEMEVWASSNGLFDEIWPDDDYLRNLKIPK